MVVERVISRQTGPISRPSTDKKKVDFLLAELKVSSRSKDLKRGTRAHAEAVDSGKESNMYVASSLIDMYAKCGCMGKAEQVFDKLPQPDVVSWTALILGYALNGESEQALQLFQRMYFTCCAPNALTFVAALKACTVMASKEEGRDTGGGHLKLVTLEKGMAVHSLAACMELGQDIFLATTLVDMYSKCGTMVYARKVFDSFPSESAAPWTHTAAMWTALMFGYAQNGEELLALKLFSVMRTDHRYKPVSSTYLAVLKACTCLAEKEQPQQRDEKLVKLMALECGVAVHVQARKDGSDTDISVASALVDMYSKSGSLTDARRVFDAMENHDTVSWNSIILAYARGGDGVMALQLYEFMQSQGCLPVRATFLAALEACMALADKEQGREVDDRLVKMVALETGMAIHAQAETSRKGSLDVMVANTLIDMYAQSGSLADAERMFDAIPSRNSVSWTVLMLGYCQENGEGAGVRVFQLLSRMKAEGFVPSSQALVAALKSCGNSTAFETGKEVHAEIIRRGLEHETHLQTCLVGLYSKCGSGANAQQVFDSVPGRGIEIWTAVIAVYSREGDWNRVIDLFYRLVEEGVQPNALTFLSVLMACGRGGHVEAGKFWFETMSTTYGLEPGPEHYHCMVDLFGRANDLEKAVGMAERIPPTERKALSLAWTTVLGACHKWSNVQVGERAFMELLMVDGEKASASYVLMANLYSGTE